MQYVAPDHHFWLQQQKLWVLQRSFSGGWSNADCLADKFPMAECQTLFFLVCVNKLLDRAAISTVVVLTNYCCCWSSVFLLCASRNSLVQNGANNLRIQTDRSTRHCQTYWAGNTAWFFFFSLIDTYLQMGSKQDFVVFMCKLLFCEIPSFLSTLLWGMFSSLLCVFHFTQGAPNKLNSRKYGFSAGGLQP